MTITPPSAEGRPGRSDRSRSRETRAESRLAAYHGFAHNLRYQMDRVRIAVWQVTSALLEAEDELDALPPPSRSPSP